MPSLNVFEAVADHFLGNADVPKNQHQQQQHNMAAAAMGSMAANYGGFGGLNGFAPGFGGFGADLCTFFRWDVREFERLTPAIPQLRWA